MTKQITQEQTQRERIISLAETAMRNQASQYTFDERTAFLYLGRVKENGRYVIGLLETDPRSNTYYPYCTADMTCDNNPMWAISQGLGYLSAPDCSFKIWKHINHFGLSPEIETLPVEDGLEAVLRTCIERQNQINAYAKGLSYLNEQVRGGKSK